jgi:hypothetical protein
MAKIDEPIREILIDNIIEMAGDEFESRNSWIALAKKSDEELVLEMINIAQYFRNQNNC